MSAANLSSLIEQLADLLASAAINQAQHDTLAAQHHEEIERARQETSATLLAGEHVVMPFRPNILYAAARVLNTAELLENILLRVPEQHLHAKVPLVCQAFRHTIHTSILLQRKLFLATDWDKSKFYCSHMLAKKLPRLDVKGSSKCHVRKEKSCACSPRCVRALELVVKGDMEKGTLIRLLSMKACDGC